MPTIKLTDAAAKRLKAPAGSRVDYFDATLPGFALRVSGATDRAPEGRRTWTLFYRYGGVQRRLTLEPPYPALGLAEARRKAGDALATLAEGKDPGAAKADVKAAAARAPDTITRVVDLFIKRHLEGRKRAPRYVEETRRNFSNHVLPRWGERDIRTITRRDVIELLDAVMDDGSTVRDGTGKRRKVPGGPIAANRVLAATRALFNFALKRAIIESTPAALVDRPGAEITRDRTLTADEIRPIWEAASALGYPFGQFFRLVLITGQRRNEVARMRWCDLNFDEALWTLPAVATKAGRAHVVPLAPLAIEILTTLPRHADTPFVFTTRGRASISGYSKAKYRIDRAVTEARGGEPLSPWTIHDLRRTAATEMARLGVSRFVVGRVLNHADRGVTSIYDRHAYLAEKRHALQVWAASLGNLTRPPSANVVAMRRAMP
jgi:integrase